MKKLAAVGYIILFRNFKLAPMIKTYKYASCHQVLKIRERYIKLSKGLLHPNPLWNSADKLPFM